MKYNDNEIYQMTHYLSPWNELYIYGSNVHHGLGFKNTDMYIPETKKIIVAEAAVRYDYGYFHTCYLDESGNLYGFGNNEYGQIGPSRGPYLEGATLIDNDVEDFVCGPVSTLYFKNGVAMFLGKMYNSSKTEFVKYPNTIRDYITPYNKVTYVAMGETVMVYMLKNILEGTSKLYIQGDWAKYNMPATKMEDGDTHFGSIEVYGEDIKKIIPTRDNLFMITESTKSENLGEISVIMYGQQPQFKGYCQTSAGVRLDKGITDISISKDQKKLIVVMGNSIYEKPLWVEGDGNKC